MGFFWRILFWYWSGCFGRVIGLFYITIFVTEYYYRYRIFLGLKKKEKICSALPINDLFMCLINFDQFKSLSLRIGIGSFILSLRIMQCTEDLLALTIILYYNCIAIHSLLCTYCIILYLPYFTWLPDWVRYVFGLQFIIERFFLCYFLNTWNYFIFLILLKFYFLVSINVEKIFKFLLFFFI